MEYKQIIIFSFEPIKPRVVRSIFEIKALLGIFSKTVPFRSHGESDLGDIPSSINVYDSPKSLPVASWSADAALQTSF